MAKIEMVGAHSKKENQQMKYKHYYIDWKRQRKRAHIKRNVKIRKARYVNCIIKLYTESNRKIYERSSNKLKTVYDNGWLYYTVVVKNILAFCLLIIVTETN